MAFNRDLFQQQASKVKAGAAKVTEQAAALAISNAGTALAASFPAVAVGAAAFPTALEIAKNLPIKQPIIPLPGISLPEFSADALASTLTEKSLSGVALAKRAALESISEKLPRFEALKAFSNLSPSNLTSLIPPQVGSALAAAKAGAAQVQGIIGQAQSTAAAVKSQATSVVQSSAATAQGAFQGAATAVQTAATEQAVAAVEVVKTKATAAWKSTQT